MTSEEEHKSFFIAAQQSNWSLWRTIATLALIVPGIFIGQIPLAIAIQWVNPGAIGIDSSDPSSFGLDQNLTLFLLILTFAGGLLALMIGVKWIHNQPLLTLITPGKIDWKKLFFSAGLWFGLTLLVELVLYLLAPMDYRWTFRPESFFPLMIVAMLFLPIQTTFEEVLFRGYLMQHIGLLLNNKLAALLITAIIFGLMHLANPEVKAFGLTRMMIYYIGFGVFLGLCTLLDNRLEIALGLHASTNIYGAMMVTFEESALQTPALITVDNLDIQGMLIMFFLVAFIFFIYLARCYRWRLTELTLPVRQAGDGDFGDRNL